MVGGRWRVKDVEEGEGVRRLGGCGDGCVVRTDRRREQDRNNLRGKAGFEDSSMQ